ncbi:hypothetical protein EVAR_51518_1 [Eumeta japonica]|uniref:Uncharacterized protein n=1 Tax=Eumeta variegata TaxID=151549 RepID=A0A4C1XFH7_EUMVA|nr:hypothetical protein EVAR_51518_1 [Eumeta japonica]
MYWSRARGAQRGLIRSKPKNNSPACSGHSSAPQVHALRPGTGGIALFAAQVMLPHRSYDASCLRLARTIGKALSGNARSNNTEAIVITDVSFTP